jgi:hypothetical protein
MEFVYPILEDGPMTFDQFIAAHHRANDGLRLGQRFINVFIKNEGHGDADMFNILWNTTDERVAKNLIIEWLARHQYHTNMPPVFRPDLLG